MTMRKLVLLLALVAACRAVSAAQAIGGVATDVIGGASLPVNAKPHSLFILTSTSPWQAWLCVTTPSCTLSSHWVQLFDFDVVVYDAFGNASILGKFSANQLATTGLGPWWITGNYGSLSPSGAGNFVLGAGPTCLMYSYNTSALVCVSLLDAFGNVAANANTATRLLNMPTNGAGDYCTGVDEYGNCIPSGASYINVPTQTLCSGISGIPGRSLQCWDTSGTWININNAGWVQVTTTSGISGPSPSSSTPLMDGTGAAGSATTYARGDHVHPSDTSRVPTSTTVNGHALTGNVTVAPADLAAGAFATGMTAANQTVGDNSGKLANTKYVRDEIILAFTCPVPGTSSVSSYCNWTLPAGITVIGLDAFSGTPPAGCSTFPIIQVWDATAVAEVGSFSITLGTSQANTGVTGSTAVASGHLLRLRVTTAGVGCSPNASNVTATVSYQMTN